MGIPFKTWELWTWVELPSPWPPPWNAEAWGEYRPSRNVQGFFRQDQSKETIIAAAQGTRTIGRFCVMIAENIPFGALLFDSEEGKYIRLEGDPLKAPPGATTQIKTYLASVTSRTQEELTEQRLRGSTYGAS